MDRIIHLCCPNIDHASSCLEALAWIDLGSWKTLFCIASLTVIFSHSISAIHCHALLWHRLTALSVGCVYVCPKFPGFYYQGQLETFLFRSYSRFPVYYLVFKDSLMEIHTSANIWCGRSLLLVANVCASNSSRVSSSLGVITVFLFCNSFLKSCACIVYTWCTNFTHIVRIWPADALLVYLKKWFPRGNCTVLHDCA